MSDNSIFFKTAFAPNSFGFGMDSRAFSGEKDWFGFGGQACPLFWRENDNELKGDGNSLDFGGRIYDSRLGRWLSLDPMQAKYPDISPYSYTLNSPVQFVDPDGKDVVDPKTREKVVKVNGQWQTASGGAVSKEFIENTQPVLDKITSSVVGTKIYDELQHIRTIVVIDLSDKQNVNSLKQNGANSKLRTVDPQWTTGNDGLYNDVVITPDLNRIETQAKVDGIDFEEKPIQTMSVEKDHISTKEQIDKEASYDYDFNTKEALEDVYSAPLNEAIKVGKKYRRDEKGQTPDASSNIPVTRMNKNTGTNIKIKA